MFKRGKVKLGFLKGNFWHMEPLAKKCYAQINVRERGGGGRYS